MKKFFTLFFPCFFFLNMCFAQQYSTGKRALIFTDASRSGRQVPTEVYYPATIAGNDVPVATGLDKFPVVAFGHGFVIPVSAYKWLADSLVKNGYIVVFPSTESGLSPDHAAFGADLLFLCNRVTSLNDSVASFLYQRVINKAAVAGHSMGGGCSFLAASVNAPTIKAIFNFAAAETNPSSTAAASSVSKPALIFSGSGDCIVAPAVQQQMFANVTASCKTYINITGALHCQFANNNGTCAFGQLTTGCNSSSITPAIVFNKTTALVIPFLDFYLKDICTRGDDFINATDAMTGVVKIRACNALPGCGPLPVTLEKFTGQLVNNEVFLNWKTASEYDLGYFSVEKSADGASFQSFGQLLPKGGVSTSTTYNITDQTPYPVYTYYRLKTVNRDGRFSYSGIIKIATPKKVLAMINLFPNPVNNVVQVEFVSGKRQDARLRVFNTTGEMLVNQLVTLQPGLNKTLLVLDKLPAGLYVLASFDGQGLPCGMMKIIKK